ncbi:MAG: SDR family oxidoreductase [Dehalococcoidia bacterium]|nr:SDR family oxidoreductase [Dehalococcoidia bacterium]
MALDWLDLTGKVAFVTGSGHGIGAGIAEALSAAGAKVIVSDINEEVGSATASRLGAPNIPLDVTDREAVDRTLARVASEFGALDVLVNNAGIYRGFGGPIATITDEMWQKLWAVNVEGLFYCCRAAARIMVAGGRGGRIINIASTQSVSPGVGVTYDGSKGAVLQITRSLALELGPKGVNVNAVAPGATWVMDMPAPPLTGVVPPPTGDALADTVASRIARIPLGRWGQPIEVGKACLFLASGMADFITGVYLPVDGGWLVE